MIGGSMMKPALVNCLRAAATFGMLGLSAAAAANIAGVAEATAAAPAPALTVDKADTAWMLTSTILVLLMILPGLALFYGGLVRTKNMLSVLSQVLGITSLAILVWVGWGYSLAFDAGSPYLGGTSKFFLSGITGDTAAATFSDGVGIPELVFAAFQMTFAAITAALVVGAVAERVKFSAIMLFTVIWLTIVYSPIAHMV